MTAAIAAMLIFTACSSTTPAPRGHAMKIESVRMDLRTSSPVLLLSEESGLRRKLPIWIGPYEAQSIALGMENVQTPRPNTHDLIQNIVDGLRGKIRRVTVTELRENTYYALVELELDGSRIEVDSRPSDAIAVAVRMGVPIFASEAVLEAAARRAEDEPALEIEWPVGGGSTVETRRH
ncbi:MAG: bifunctional nuclease family protein [Myxococcota bacterium]